MKNMKNWTESADIRLEKILARLTGWQNTDALKDLKQDFYVALLTRKQERLTDANFWSCMYCKAHNFLKDYFQKKYARDRRIKFISYYAEDVNTEAYDDDSATNAEGACSEVIKKISNDFIHASNPFLMEKCDALIDGLILFDSRHCFQQDNTGLLDLLSLLVNGYSQRQIAALWDVSEKTVSIRRKKLQKIYKEISLKN